MYDAECEQVDQFLASYKTLDGLMPEWNDFYRRDWQLRWGIVDENEIQRGELCITCNAELTEISFCVMFNHRLIYRLDIVPVTECKDNPYSAMDLNLPAQVCGPHVHGWPENREYVRVNGFGSLPHRRPIDGLTQTVSDGLGWVSEDLGIAATAEQRVCDLPPQKGLFAR
jgi:hypothetical protein